MSTKPGLFKPWAAVLFVLILAGLAGLAGCGGSADRPPATTTDTIPPMTTTVPPTTTVAPAADVDEDRGDELIRMTDDPLGIRELDLDAVNAAEPLEDVHFNFDSAALEDEARRVLDGHAEVLKQYPSMTVLIEGHCDERGTVEYNLALGERRANAVLNYLVSLGVPQGRLKTISYGKEFPKDPRHNEEAWAANRRAHFRITAK